MEQAEFAEIRNLVRPLAKLGAVLCDAEKLVDSVTKLNQAIVERTRRVEELNATAEAKAAEVRSLELVIADHSDEATAILDRAGDAASAIKATAEVEANRILNAATLAIVEAGDKSRADLAKAQEIAEAKLKDVHQAIYDAEAALESLHGKIATLKDMEQDIADAKAVIAKAEAIKLAMG